MSDSTNNIPNDEFPDGFNFSLEPRQWKFSIGTRQFVLREAAEKAHTKYRNVMMRNLVFTGDEAEKKGSFVGGAEADTILLAECLFEIVPMTQDDGKLVVVDGKQQFTERPLPLQEVDRLPRSITSRLHVWLKKNSAIEEETETAEFLIKRIESDQKKLTAIQSRGTAGKGGQSSISSTSG